VADHRPKRRRRAATAGVLLCGEACLTGRFAFARRAGVGSVGLRGAKLSSVACRRPARFAANLEYALPHDAWRYVRGGTVCFGCFDTGRRLEWGMMDSMALLNANQMAIGLRRKRSVLG